MRIAFILFRMARQPALLTVRQEVSRLPREIVVVEALRDLR